jgi:hypothetical protein
MHSNEDVAEYVIIKSICISCNPNYVFVMSFCCPFYLNIPNLSIIVKTDGPVRIRERERIKKFICKTVYFIEKYSGSQSS